jgi:hypothetical protein
VLVAAKYKTAPSARTTIELGELDPPVKPIRVALRRVIPRVERDLWARCVKRKVERDHQARSRSMRIHIQHEPRWSAMHLRLAFVNALRKYRLALANRFGVANGDDGDRAVRAFQ